LLFVIIVSSEAFAPLEALEAFVLLETLDPNVDNSLHFVSVVLVVCTVHVVPVVHFMNAAISYLKGSLQEMDGIS